jgi:hypothetical protein
LIFVGLFLADRLPRFYQGDSLAYMTTGLNGWIRQMAASALLAGVRGPALQPYGCAALSGVCGDVVCVRAVDAIVWGGRGGLSSCARGSVKEEKQFFFEKKNQKTFASWAYTAGQNRDSDIKSFASFLQKRRPCSCEFCSGDIAQELQ